MNSDPELRTAFLKAVKHMEQEDEAGLHELPKKLGEINVKLEGIYNHLGTLNHRTEKSEERIMDTEKEIAGIKGTAQVVGWVSGIASSVVVAGILYAVGLRK